MWAFCQTMRSRKDFAATLSMLDSRSSLLSSGKLPEESQVVLVEVADVIDAVEHHGEALEAHAEGVAGPGRGIIANGLIHGWVDHAAAADFNPLLVHLGQVPGGEVDLETGFGVAEVVRTEPRLGVGAEERGKDVVKQRLEVADGHVLVDIEAFKLVEVGAVGGIGGVAPERAAGRHDAHRGRMLQHGADLHRGGVCPQEIFFTVDPAGDVAEARRVGKIERVLHVARGVSGRRVERVEAVEFSLHLRAIGDREADLAQDAAHLLAHQRERMVGAGAAVRRRQ